MCCSSKPTLKWNFIPKKTSWGTQHVSIPIGTIEKLKSRQTHRKSGTPNKHAFTKHIGLKDTDTRREYSIYHEGFIKCFEQYLEDDYSKLQNLGEGYDYNNGSEISKKYFPLRNDIHEKIKWNSSCSSS